MNILYLTQVFSSTRGGGPLIFYDLANGLSHMGHKIYVICNITTETIYSTNVNIVLVKPILRTTSELTPSPIENLRYITNSVISGARVIKKSKIDLIHTNQYAPQIAGSILSNIMRIPMVATIHDVFTDADNNNWRNWAKQNNLSPYHSVLGRAYEQISLNMPLKLIHTVSNTTKEDLLLRKTKRPIRVINPAINLKTPKDIGIRYEDFVLYIGRLVFYKNIDVLIRAHSKVIKELPSAKLIIVGEGPMDGELRKLAHSLGINDNIQFTGHISQEDKMDLLSRCSALALPSTFEGFGLVILEAFAMAKPVLVPNIHPLDEIVDDKVNGFLLSNDDIERWAKAIITLVTDKRLCKQMGYNAAQKFTNRYDFSIYLKNMESLYLEVLENVINRRR